MFRHRWLIALAAVVTALTLIAGDADGFWDLVTERGDDDLKWCGTSSIYTFLRAVPGVRGRVHGYEQWNIDSSSVVSFGALSFSRN